MPARAIIGGFILCIISGLSQQPSLARSFGPVAEKQCAPGLNADFSWALHDPDRLRNLIFLSVVQLSVFDGCNTQCQTDITSSALTAIADWKYFLGLPQNVLFAVRTPSDIFIDSRADSQMQQLDSAFLQSGLTNWEKLVRPNDDADESELENFEAAHEKLNGYLDLESADGNEPRFRDFVSIGPRENSYQRYLTLNGADTYNELDACSIALALNESGRQHCAIAVTPLRIHVDRAVINGDAPAELINRRVVLSSTGCINVDGRALTGWEVQCSGTPLFRSDLTQIMRHEIGHWLGARHLDKQDDADSDIMESNFGNSSCFTERGRAQMEESFARAMPRASRIRERIQWQD